MEKLRVIEGQTLLDIAIEKYGYLAGVFDLLEDNPQYSITSIPVPGTEISIKTDIVDPNQEAAFVRKYFSNRDMSISSGFTAEVITSTGFYVDEDYWDEDYTEDN